jgi:hypothetical protein
MVFNLYLGIAVLGENRVKKSEAFYSPEPSKRSYNSGSQKYISKASLLASSANRCGHWSLVLDSITSPLNQYGTPQMRNRAIVHRTGIR